MSPFKPGVYFRFADSKTRLYTLLRVTKTTVTYRRVTKTRKPHAGVSPFPVTLRRDVWERGHPEVVGLLPDTPPKKVRPTKKPVRPAFKKGESLVFPVASLEFVQGGNTLWVHAPDGSTLLRLKTLNGHLSAKACATSPVAHADGTLQGDLNLCVPRKT